MPNCSSVLPQSTAVRGDGRVIVSPLVSIIIVNYNGYDYLPQCLDSVLTDASDEVELIVVDNASTDDSVTLIEQRYPQIRLLHTHENVGFGGANNLAAAQANGRYLIFLNPDTVTTAGWWRPLIEALQQNPAAGLATAKILLLDRPDRVNAAGNEMHLTGLTLCRGLNDPAHQWDEMDYVTAVSGAAFAMRKSLFAELEGFDTDFFMYFEDTDLSLRSRLWGYECLYVPQSIVYHDYQLRFGPRKTYYEERNRYVTLLKSLRWPTLFLLGPVWLLSELITWGFVLTQDRLNWRNKLYAYRDVLRHRQEIMKHRHHTQKRRRISDRELLQPLTYRLAFEQTDAGWVAQFAHFVFTPLFYLARLSTRVVVWW